MNDSLREQAPSFRLCKRIPEGMFNNSALVYQAGNDWHSLCVRGEGFPTYIDQPKDIPAPMLAELVSRISNITGSDVNFEVRNNGRWRASTSIFTPGEIQKHRAEGKTITNAALKLFFALKGIQK